MSNLNANNMKNSLRTLDRCRLCNSGLLDEIHDFGKVCLGNDLRETRDEALQAQSFPLSLKHCNDCGHYQLGYAVSPTRLFATNYTYLSGTGASFTKHLSEYAHWITEKCDLKGGDVVVDVGSNDGSGLSEFRSLDFVVCGVDPAQKAANIANANGIFTINEFFNEAVVGRIVDKFGRPKFVTSHNVLAHVDDLQESFRLIYELLHDGGWFCFEVGYFQNVLEGGLFDTIYHEHLDYHHAGPLVSHLVRLGFDICNISTNAIQGGSLRILAQKKNKGSVLAQPKAFVLRESKKLVAQHTRVKGWMAENYINMRSFKRLIEQRKNDKQRIVGYGAPTKATLLLKVAGLTNDEISFIIDDNPLKAGRYLPGTAIPIKSPANVDFESIDVIVIFAWNFSTDIIQKLKKNFDRSVEILLPLPELKAVTL